MPDILITSAILPPIPVSFASSGGPSTGPSLVMRILRPRVQVLAPDGSALVDVAPGGQPPNTWPFVAFGMAALATLILFFAVKGALK